MLSISDANFYWFDNSNLLTMGIPMPCIWSMSFISCSLLTDVLDMSNLLLALNVDSSVSSSFDIVKFGAKISISF